MYLAVVVAVALTVGGGSMRVSFPAPYGLPTCSAASALLGRCEIDLSLADGGGLYVGGASVDVSGSSISCLPAGDGDGGCMTVGNQTFLGAKTWSASQTFNGGVVSNGTVQTNFVQPLVSGAGMLIYGWASPNDPGSDITIQTLQWRDGGYLLEVDNGSIAVQGTTHQAFAVGYDGTVYSGAGFSSGGGSGGTTTTCRTSPCYAVHLGNLPTNYYGAHGAVTFGNANPGEKYIAEFKADNTGTGADSKLFIGSQGGLTWGGGQVYANLRVCSDNDVAPLDGGIIGTDAGPSPTSTLVWVQDKHRLCYCDATQGDGGPLTGWRRVSDDAACGP